jgi:serine/threonine-protein kinase RIO1
MILFKMLNQNVIYEINGCISTGKEVKEHFEALYRRMFITQLQKKENIELLKFTKHRF